MSKGLQLFLGFTITFLGVLSVVLSLIGVQFAFLLWIDAFGRLAGFVFRLLMIMGGIVIIVLAQTDWKKEEEMLSELKNE